MPALQAGMGVWSPEPVSPALPARFLGGSCLAPSPAWSSSTEVLLINGLFSAGDLHHTFCTPGRSGRRGITLTSGETSVPSVFSWLQAFLGKLQRWSTKYFLLHFSLNHCQRKDDEFWNVLPPPFPPRSHTQRLHLLFHNMISCIFSLLSDKIHMFPPQTICHSRFFCTKVFLMLFSPDWFLSIIARGGAFDRRNFHPKATYRHRCPLWPEAPGIKSFQLPGRAELGFSKLVVSVVFFFFFPPRNQNTPGNPAQQRKSCLLFQD